jgi:hypothetical protein
MLKQILEEHIFITARNTRVLRDVKLNQGLSWQQQHPATRRLFSPENWTSGEVRNW